ncbi:MAG: MFS transporter [Solirubrobacteraceae bacterium]
MSPTDQHHHDRRWAILALLGIAQLMVVLDATIVNIALPSAQDSLGFGDESRQWVVTAYALAFGSLLLLGGKLGDLFGRKWTFIGGLIGFAVASAIGGMAGSFGVLVAARAAQGVFGAILAPSALALLTVTFTEPQERAKAFGIFGAIAGGGAAVGLLLGGILTEYLSWRWCLYVNLLFALPAAFAAFTLLRNPERSGARPRLDLVGTGLATSGLFALVFGFSHAETDGWSNGVTIGMLAYGVIAIAAFAAWQNRAKHPLLPLRVVLDRNRGGAYLSMAIAGAGMFGVFLFLTFFMQRNLGYSPIQSGLAFLPLSAVIIVTATTGQIKLVPRYGPRVLMTLGMVLASASMVFLAQLDADSTYLANVLPALILQAAGMGLIFSPAFASATAGVRPSDAGVASAMVNTSQQVGGSVGTAFLSTMANSAASGFSGTAAEASVHGFTTAFWWAAGIFAFGAIVAGFVIERGVPQHAPIGEPAMAH